MMRCDDALEYLLAKCAAPPTTPNAAGTGMGTPTRASFASSSFTGDSRAEQAALMSPSGVGISSPGSVSSPGGISGDARPRTIHVDLTDRSGRSALHYAALLGHATAIKLLLNAGACECSLAPARTALHNFLRLKQAASSRHAH